MKEVLSNESVESVLRNKTASPADVIDAAESYVKRCGAQSLNSLVQMIRPHTPETVYATLAHIHAFPAIKFTSYSAEVFLEALTKASSTDVLEGFFDYLWREDFRRAIESGMQAGKKGARPMLAVYYADTLFRIDRAQDGFEAMRRALEVVANRKSIDQFRESPVYLMGLLLARKEHFSESVQYDIERALSDTIGRLKQKEKRRVYAVADTITKAPTVTRTPELSPNLAAAQFGGAKFPYKNEGLLVPLKEVALAMSR